MQERRETGPDGMTTRPWSPSERVAAAIGSLGVCGLSVLAGIGGPPSEFRRGVPRFVDFLGDHILEIYAAAALIALAGLLVSLFVPQPGRIISTVGSLVTMFGNLVSIAIGTSGEGRAALIFVGLSTPFLLLMWVPRLVSRRIRGHADASESPGRG
jgi:hypothetical protein